MTIFFSFLACYLCGVLFHEHNATFLMGCFNSAVTVEIIVLSVKAAKKNYEKKKKALDKVKNL